MAPDDPDPKDCQLVPFVGAHRTLSNAGSCRDLVQARTPTSTGGPDVPVPTSPIPSLLRSDGGNTACSDAGDAQDGFERQASTSKSKLGFLQVECQVEGCHFVMMKQPSKSLGFIIYYINFIYIKIKNKNL